MWDVCCWWVRVRGLWQRGWDGKTCGHSVTMTSSIIMLFWCNETPPHRTHPTILSVSLTTTKQTAVSWSHLASPRYQIKLWQLLREEAADRTQETGQLIFYFVLSTDCSVLGRVYLVLSGWTAARKLWLFICLCLTVCSPCFCRAHFISSWDIFDGSLLWQFLCSQLYSAAATLSATAGCCSHDFGELSSKWDFCIIVQTHMTLSI